jgi:germination protein M
VIRQRSVKIALVAAWAVAVVLLVGVGLKLFNELVLTPDRIAPGTRPVVSREREKRKIDIFFADENASMLVAEKRSIMLGAAIPADAKALVAEIIKGPESDTLLSTLPGGVRLLAAYEVGDTLVLDFSNELQTNHSGGSTGELFAVYSIVNTVALSLDEVAGVRILVEGMEVETLAGHLDLTRPLSIDLKLLERPRRQTARSSDYAG